MRLSTSICPRRPCCAPWSFGRYVPAYAHDVLCSSPVLPAAQGKQLFSVLVRPNVQCGVFVNLELEEKAYTRQGREFCLNDGCASPACLIEPLSRAANALVPQIRMLSQQRAPVRAPGQGDARLRQQSRPVLRAIQRLQPRRGCKCHEPACKAQRPMAGDSRLQHRHRRCHARLAPHQREGAPGG